MAEEDNNPTLSETASATANSNHLKQKRARSQLSCTPCRQGKLKCNRQHDPACDQCIKRSRESACIYVPPPVKHKAVQNVKGRIRQLENLVVDLMNQNRTVQGQTTSTSDRTMPKDDPPANAPYSQPTPPSDNDTSPQITSETSQQTGASPNDVDAATTPFGQMKISKGEISYVGESHWGAILNSISDLKRDLSDEEEEDDGADNTPEQTMHSWGSVPMGGIQPHATTGLGFMLGDSMAVTKEQLISSAPEKRKADRYLSLWFNSPDPFKPIIHAPTFQEEYRRFLRNPKDTPVMWLGLFYAILSLAASFGLRDVNPADPQARTVLEEVNKYHTLSASAAVLADFTKPKQYTIECLILYAAGLRSNDAFVNVWLMIGLIVRLSLRMGYHRDPSHYPAITVFHGEMRRRVWAIISMIDVLISFQLGLPSIIKTIHADIQPPRNLLDRDFSLSTQVLPAGRGIEELTPSSYTRAKLQIVRIFADAAELNHATIVPTRDETMRLDRELDEAKAAIPPLLQMPDISELVTDPAEQLMCRFNLDLLYLKTKIVLHRRYMLTPHAQLTPAEQQRGIGDSRKACINCALRVLQHHQTIYTASQTGGQLDSVKWYMGSISTHDFLLAAMIICLELSTQLGNPNDRAAITSRKCPQRRAMMDSLENSQRIWSEASGRKRKFVQFTGVDEKSKGEHMFDETEKASRAMAVMLEKVKAQMDTPMPQASNSVASPIKGFTNGYDIAASDTVGQVDSSQSQSPFQGIVSMHSWGEVQEVPHSFDHFDASEQSGQVFYSNSGSVTGLPSNHIVFGDNSNNSQISQSNDTTPNQGFKQSDYSMIGNMLDVHNNLDWEMWDNEITKGQQPSYANWPDDIDTSNLSDMPDNSMRYGNAASGGTGPVRGIVPGNAILLDGTGPLSGNFSGLDYNMAMMDNADFDALPMDYDKVSMWQVP